MPYIPSIWIWLGIIASITLSGLFSGLNLAIFTLSQLRLQLEADGGNKDAACVLDLRKNSNAVLATVIWGNVGTNVFLTLLSGSVFAGFGAFFFSTVMITLFGEIAPQAYFSRNALRMAARFLPFLIFWRTALFFVVRPTAALLNLWLGVEGIVYLHERDVRSLVARAAAGGGDIGKLEATGVQNFLDLDDLAVTEEGEPVDAQSIISLPLANGRCVNDPFFEKMKLTGIEVQWSNPSFLVTHEKSIIVDGKSALLPTFNFMEKYFQATRDYGVLTNDPVQVEQIQKCFDCDWKREPFHPLEDAGLAWSPGYARQFVCKLIDRARKTLDIQHPKFAEPVMLERMLAAIYRGVRVRILCGGKHGLHQPDLMYSFALWRLMHQAGARVHKQKNLRAHAKLLVVDDKWALLGSQNFDQPAFDLRREVAIEVRDAAIVQDLTSMFERDWETSRKYEPPYPCDKPAEEEEHEFPHDTVLMHD